MIMREALVCGKRIVWRKSARGDPLGAPTIFFRAESRLRDNSTGWRERAIPKIVKRLYGTGFILLFRSRRAKRWSARITVTSSPSPSPWRDDLDFTRRAREGRFTIHKTTRRIELSSLALCGSCQSRPPPGGRCESA